MAIKAVGFDFNGTLMNDWGLMYDVMCHHVEVGMGKVPTVPQFLEEFQPPYLDYLRHRGSIIPDSLNWSIWDEVRPHHEIGAQEGVIPLLESLTERRIPMYVITANQHARAEAGLAEHGLTRFFSALYADDEDKVTGIRKVLHDHELHPHEMMYVGDMRIDMWAAFRTQVFGIGIGSARGHEAKHCEVLRRAGASHAFRSMTAFHAALENGLWDNP